jgi:hypothetical protein
VVLHRSSKFAGSGLRVGARPLHAYSLKVMLGLSANSGRIFAENSVMTLERGGVHSSLSTPPILLRGFFVVPLSYRLSREHRD